MNITMTGRELREFLGAVLPHASKADRFNPALCTVTFEVAGRHLYAVATDRYTLGIARHELPELAPTLTVGVNVSALQAVARQAKPRPDITLLLTGDGLTVELNDPQMTFRLPAVGDDPPVKDWRGLMKDILAKDPNPDSTCANPAFLARFRAAARGGQPLEMRRAGHCMVITCGDHFLGSIAMTRRFSDSSLAGWPIEQATAVAS